MAYTAPRTWVTNEVPTATIFNTHVRDNFHALRSAAFGTASGLNSSTLAFFNVTVGTDDVQAFGSFGWNPSTSYWTVPWTGRFLCILNLTCTGQTGTAGSGGQINRYNSAGTVLQHVVTTQDSGVINGRCSMSGLTLATAGDRIYFYEYNNSTGSAGAVAAECFVLAHG